MKTEIKLDGKSLERATELIEKHILNQIEKSEIGEVTIVSNKIKIVDGVKHEIDVYVEIDLKIGAKLVYIFECKDWRSKKVSKNDIIIFDEKIDVFNAQKGYFVAKEYTKDAINRAKLNTRIEVLNLITDSIFDVKEFIDMKSMQVSNVEVTINLNPFPLNYRKDVGEYILGFPNSGNRSISQLVFEVLSHHVSKEYPCTTILRNEEYWEFKLRYDNILFENHPIQYIEIIVKTNYSINRPQIVLDYNIEGKGSYIKIKDKDLFGQNYVITELTKSGKTITFNSMKMEKIIE